MIDFQAKTDRELLVLAAQKCNEMSDHLQRINGKLGDHDKRIYHLEHRWRLPRPNWQILGIIASFIALVVIGIYNKLKGG